MIELSDVSFSYEHSEQGVLDHVSLSIKPGECVLFCGESGCGKTTITRLLNGLIPHFYEGKLEGEVRIDASFSVWIPPVRLHLAVKIWVCRKRRS